MCVAQWTHPTVENRLTVGGNGGHQFLRHRIHVGHGQAVVRIDVWVTYKSIGGILLTFSDGTDNLIGRGGPKHKHEYFGHIALDYEHGEVVNAISIWGNGSGTRCGAFRIWTNRGQDFFPRMTKWRILDTSKYPIDTGPGVILGAEGREGHDIDALGFLMLNEIEDLPRVEDI